MGTESFLRLPAVMAQVGYSKSRIYALVAKGQFPQPIRLGERASAWLKSEIDAWIAARVAASRGAA